MPLIRLPRGVPIVPDVYDATTSITQLAQDARLGSGTGFSVLVTAKVLGAGEANTGNYFLSMNDTVGAAGRNGFIFRLQTNINNGMGFIGDSSGVANAPSVRSTNATWTAGNVVHAAASWDGGVDASGVVLYASENGSPLVAVAMTTTTNGSGSPITAASLVPYIGNNPTNTRTFNGPLFRVTVWAGAKSGALLEFVRSGLSPWALSSLLLDYYNGADHGPNAIPVVARTALAVGTPSFYVAPEKAFKFLPFNEAAITSSYIDPFVFGGAI